MRSRCFYVYIPNRAFGNRHEDSAVPRHIRENPQINPRGRMI
jgi:hypothetical protein